MRRRYPPATTDRHRPVARDFRVGVCNIRYPRYPFGTTERRWSDCTNHVEVAVARGAPSTRSRSSEGDQCAPANPLLRPFGLVRGHALRARPFPFERHSGLHQADFGDVPVVNVRLMRAFHSDTPLQPALQGRNIHFVGTVLRDELFGGRHRGLNLRGTDGGN